MESGTLYVVGVGPGSPDLLTIRASKILNEAQIILAAASSKNDYSLAFEIIKSFLNKDAETIRLDFPMTKDFGILKQAWHLAAQKTSEYLDKDLKCVFVTLGDPLFYSTFSYLSRELLQIRPKASFKIIPGITAFQAAAAKTHCSLGLGEESLRIIPGTLKKADLQYACKNPNPLVIIKAYRNLPSILECLKKNGRFEQAILVSRVEQEGENIMFLKDWPPDSVPPYMSLIICPEIK